MKESFEKLLRRIKNKRKEEIKFPRELSLGELAKAIKEKVAEGKKVEGNISYKIISRNSSGEIRIKRIYNFLNKSVGEIAIYENSSQPKEIIKDGLENIAYVVKPHSVTSLGDKFFVETSKKELSNTFQ